MEQPDDTGIFRDRVWHEVSQDIPNRIGQLESKVDRKFEEAYQERKAHGERLEKIEASVNRMEDKLAPVIQVVEDKHAAEDLVVRYWPKLKGYVIALSSAAAAVWAWITHVEPK